MTPEEAKLLPRSVPNPFTAGLPDYLKDPDNYDKVRKAILDAGATRHSHGDPMVWAACKTCQKAAWSRKETMKKLGFQNAQQYLAWQKIMTMMTSTKRDPLR